MSEELEARRVATGWFERNVVYVVEDFQIRSRSGDACSRSSSGRSSWCWWPPGAG